MRVALIADLHFGRVDDGVPARLLQSIRAEQPDLVLVAGDFVQRARASQFRPARAFVDSLPAPWLAVPGNHDIPLLNLPLRWTDALAPYRRWIAEDPEPRHETDTAVILGVDTTDPWSHQRGRVDRRQRERVAKTIRAERGRRTVVVMAHHPFHHGEEIEKKLMRGAPAALRLWAEAGPHVILSGHLHAWLVEPFVTREGGRETLQVHVGTGLSNRLRGSANEYAVLELDHPRIDVRRMVAGEDGAFAQIESHPYLAMPEGWRRERAVREAGRSVDWKLGAGAS
ncbi:metallophosphoesterase [Jannaschia sp. W003]|uniref:metallophosphoesterase family protein n=1 Tax=Jannaschia sp. W003 TaxID=2867012 RepID=UPI0021A50F92|nr:metallophosphoesterase [Jannaschia sp. W003]UWQ21487.1 metallophosphoesterase [Jannaschia sp. W003]